MSEHDDLPKEPERPKTREAIVTELVKRLNDSRPKLEPTLDYTMNDPMGDEVKRREYYRDNARIDRQVTRIEELARAAAPLKGKAKSDFGKAQLKGKAKDDFAQVTEDEIAKHEQAKARLKDKAKGAFARAQLKGKARDSFKRSR